MVKKYIKRILAAFCVLYFIYAGYSIYKVCIIGNLSSIESVSIENISIEHSNIVIELSSIDSALVFKHYKKEVNNDIMIIKIYKGFRIKDNEKSEKTTITENIMGIDEILLSDGKNQKIIWKRDD